MDSLDSQAAQDAAYDREHAAQEMLDVFLKGVRDSEEGMTIGGGAAFDLGQTVGWLIRGQIALKPELAPLWDALVRP